MVPLLDQNQLKIYSQRTGNRVWRLALGREGFIQEGQAGANCAIAAAKRSGNRELKDHLANLEGS
jgi:hypothetical protein